MARQRTDPDARPEGNAAGRMISMTDRSNRCSEADFRLGIVFEIRLIDRFAMVRVARPEAVIESEIAHRLRPLLTRLQNKGYIRQIVNLDGVECGSAAMVTCLTYHHRELQRRQGTLRLHGVSSRLGAALACCGLLDVLELYETENDALKGRTS